MLDLLDLFPKSLTSEAQSNQAYNQNEVKKTHTIRNYNGCLKCGIFN